MKKIFTAIQITSQNDENLRKTFRLRTLFYAYAFVAYKQRKLKLKEEQIKFVNLQLTKHVFLKKWRQNLFLELALNKVAVPFNNAQKMRVAFKSMSLYTTKNQKLKEFYKNLISKHAFKSLYKHYKLQSRSKFLLRRIQYREINQIFDALVQYTARSRVQQHVSNFIKDQVSHRLKN